MLCLCHCIFMKMFFVCCFLVFYFCTALWATNGCIILCYRNKIQIQIQLEMPKIASRAWVRPTYLTHLLSWSSLTMRREHGGWHRLKSITLTARRITIPQMQSLKWKESKTKTSSKKWARNTARSERFRREENLSCKMARARVYVNHVWLIGRRRLFSLPGH